MSMIGLTLAIQRYALHVGGAPLNLRNFSGIGKRPLATGSLNAAENADAYLCHT